MRNLKSGATVANRTRNHAICAQCWAAMANIHYMPPATTTVTSIPPQNCCYCGLPEARGMFARGEVGVPPWCEDRPKGWGGGGRA